MNLQVRIPLTLVKIVHQDYIKMKWDSFNVKYVKRDQCKTMKVKKVAYYVQWGNIKIVNSKPIALIVVVYI